METGGAKMQLVHFKCKACHSEFWLMTTPGTVSCPNPNCRYLWAPRSAIGRLEIGAIEDFQPLKVRKKDVIL